MRSCSSLWYHNEKAKARKRDTRNVFIAMCDRTPWLATLCLSWFFITHPGDDSTTQRNAERGKKERKNSHKYSYRFRYWYFFFLFPFFWKRLRSLYCFFNTFSFLYSCLYLLARLLAHSNRNEINAQERSLVLLKNLSFLRLHISVRDGFADDREDSFRL